MIDRSRTKKIYDGFTFFHELDLLELRFEELYDHVDYFILVESDHTFTNIPKSYYFDENKDRYSRFIDKVIHIKHQSARRESPWDNEHDQRNAILNGCGAAHGDDVVLISDVDEIPRPSSVQLISKSDKDLYALYTPFFYFKLNLMTTHPEGYLPIIIGGRKTVIDQYGAQHIRDTRGHFRCPPNTYGGWDCMVMHHAGWHFGYLGDDDFVKQKLLAFSHASEIPEDVVHGFSIEQQIAQLPSERLFVTLDEYFPSTVMSNPTKYQRHIVSGNYPTVPTVFSSNGLPAYSQTLG